MKALPSKKFFSLNFSGEDKAAGDVQIGGIAAVVMLIVAVVVAFIMFRSQIGQIGLGFWSAVVGAFDSIPNGLSNISYAITNGISTSISSFFTWLDANATGGVTNAFSTAWKAITGFFSWVGSKIGLSTLASGAWTL